MARFDLTDFEWGLIQPLLPNKPRGVARVDDRRVLNGIFWVLRTGSPWRDLPERYGPPTSVYNRFNRWAEAGVWVRVFAALAETPGPAAGHRQLHRAGAPARRFGQKGGSDHAIGRSRGGSSTKIDAMVEAHGLPVALALTPGQASDKAAVAELLAEHPALGDVVADRGYDARAILEMIAARGGRGHIPTQRDRRIQRRVDPVLYTQRNLVERFFNKLKHVRKIATRYERTARNVLAAVLIASSRLWLRDCESAA